ncbi:putative methyltransferase [Iris pallida]|nr:putative methyltransferase [Iris pallida]
MDLDTYFTYLRSWSAYQTARRRGFELLSDDLLADFERAWGGDRKVVKAVRYRIFLRIGKVRD